MYRGWWIVLTGYLSQMLTSGASGWVFGVLILPTQHDVGWSRSTIVGVLTVERLVEGACAAFLGPLVDRHGARLLMTVSALGAGCCLMLNALVDMPWQSYLAWGALGLAMPGLSTLGPIAAISNWFIRRRTQAVLFYTFGSATAGLLLAPAMAALAEGASWRLAWLVMGVLLWLLAPIAWLTVRHRPEDLGLAPDGDAPAAGRPPVGGATSPVATAADSGWTVERALRSHSFWLLTLGFMLTTLPASSIFIHMSAFVQSKGYSAEAGAAAVSIYGLGALAGRFVWGYATARAGLQQALVAWGVLYGVSILIYTLPGGLSAIYATTVLLGVSISGAQQLRAQAFPDYFGRRIVASLLGYAGILTTITAAAAPLLAAVAYDQTGSYDQTFTFFGICCLVAGAGFAFARPRGIASREIQRAEHRLIGTRQEAAAERRRKR